MSKIRLLTVGCLTMGALLSIGLTEPANQSRFIPDTSNELKPQALADSFTDGKAIVSNVTGEARILHLGTDEWTPVAENDEIQEGDQIRTDSDSSVDIIYDDSSLNITHIDKNTIAEFISLEPTRIYLADGSVFSSLEALPKGQNYEVATDTSVNAIRGTKFLKTFEAGEQKDSTVVADGAVQSSPVMPDGSESEESVFVSKDSTLTLTPKDLHTKPFSQLQPVLTSSETLEQINEVAGSIQKRLEDSSGGPEALKQYRERVLVTMEKPEFQEAFKTKHEAVLQKRREALAEKGGPNTGLKAGEMIENRPIVKDQDGNPVPESSQEAPREQMAPDPKQQKPSGPGPTNGRPLRAAPKAPGDQY